MGCMVLCLLPCRASIPRPLLPQPPPPKPPGEARHTSGSETREGPSERCEVHGEKPMGRRGANASGDQWEGKGRKQREGRRHSNGCSQERFSRAWWTSKWREQLAQRGPGVSGNSALGRRGGGELVFIESFIKSFGINQHPLTLPANQKPSTQKNTQTKPYFDTLSHTFRNPLLRSKSPPPTPNLPSRHRSPSSRTSARPTPGATTASSYSGRPSPPASGGPIRPKASTTPLFTSANSRS